MSDTINNSNLILSGRAAAERQPDDAARLEEKRVREILRVARKRFSLCEAGGRDIRKLALEDLNFRAGKQWPDNVIAERDADGRPCLTINRVNQFCKTVNNEQRQNRPSIQVNPVGSGADKETADILQGLVRHIENSSGADIAYDTACDHQVTMGFGYIRILKRYVAEDSFDQELYISRVSDPFKIYFDPSCEQPDYSDANFAFAFDDLTLDDFQDQYPNAKASGLDDFSALGDSLPIWIPDSRIRVMEYFFKEYTPKTLQLLQDGTSAYREDRAKEDDRPVIKARKVRIPKVRWLKMSAVEVLEETVWEAPWIPIVPVLGEEFIVEGRRQLLGMVRFAKDPQRQYNYMRSALTEAIALAPKAPYIAAAGQTEDYPQWKTANRTNHGVLPYTPITVEGQLAPPPQRSAVEPAIQAITIAVGQADNDLKATNGIYDASLGAPGPEQSGKAILARQRQGSTANFNYIDNLARSLRHLGRILVRMIPYVYDVPRMEEIVDPDGSRRLVHLNQHFVEGPDGKPQPVGADEDAPDGAIKKIYDLRTGKYDVTISVGPSYQSQRQEAVASILQLVQAFPQIMQVAGDLLVGYMDWHGAGDVAERLKALLPPQLQDANKQGPGAQIPPQMQAQIAQMVQENQTLQQALQQALTVIKTKQLELSSAERRDLMKGQVALVTAWLKQGSQEGQKMAELEYGAIANMMGHLAAEQQTQRQAEQTSAAPTAEPAQQQPAAPEPEPELQPA